MIYDTLETGRRIQKLRREAGLTQEQFAERLNISTVHLAKIETGRRNLTPQQKKYLIGQRYEAEKQADAFHGNQHTLLDESGGDQIGHHQKSATASCVPHTRRVAEETVRDIISGNLNLP